MKRFTLVVCLMAFTATSQVFAQQKDMVTGVALSVIVPGGGQFYTGQNQKAMIPIGGVVTWIGLWAIAANDSPTFSLFEGIEVDPDGDDWLFGLGWWIYVGTQGYAIFDTITSINKINSGRKYGHLMEFDNDHVTLGIDAIASRNRIGTRATFHF